MQQSWGFTMQITQIDTAEIKRRAYEMAWQKFIDLPRLTPDEKLSGPDKLRWYIHVMADVGERDPDKMAKAALGMLREYEQIKRSKARVSSPPTVSAA